mgnify:CR=1 FL=1
MLRQTDESTHPLRDELHRLPDEAPDESGGGGGGGGGGGAVALIEAREKKEPRDAWRPPFTPASAHQGGSWQYFSISASDGGTVPTFFCTIPRKASDCFGMPGWLIE